MKTISTFLIATVTLLSSCKKEEAKDYYTITGINQLTFAEQVSDTLTFSVEGKTTMVNLSVEGLPEGIKAFLSQQSGTPPFTSQLIVTREESSGGSHTIDLVGITENGMRQSYAVNILVPPLRDFRFDGKYYRIYSARNDSASRAVFVQSEQGAELSFHLPESLPNKAGTYNYRITADTPKAGEAQLAFRIGNGPFFPGYKNANKIHIDLDSIGSVIKLYLADIELSSDSEPVRYKTLGINYRK